MTRPVNNVGAVASVATPDPVRIVIADEQPIFRDGLRRLLETAPGLQIVGEAGSPLEAAVLVRERNPDILLLTLTSAVSVSLDALESLAAVGVPLRTILLTTSVDSPEVITAAIQLGACGVVPKDSGADALFNSIESVMAGNYWVGRECVSNVAASMRQLGTTSRRTTKFGLTRRELEILRSVLHGQTNKEIGRRFSISANTVKRHLSHIFDKVGASNRVELARFAAHHGLLDRQ
jgi:DNA-binding NarL/FixJ family response regulator